jgi:acyl-CoA thioesterase
VIFSICDTLAGTAATSHGVVVTTLSGAINYLNPAKDCRKLIAEAREIKYGKQTSVYQVEVGNEKGEIIAVTTFTFFHLRNLPFPE